MGVPRRLNHDDIRAACDSRSYDRGRDYFANGRVLDLEVEWQGADTLTAIATVRGTRPQPYQQVVRIGWSERGFPEISGRCTCPMAVNCKHVAAVGLAVREELHGGDPAPQAAERCLAWLDELAAAAPAAPGALPTGDFLIYLLRPGTARGKPAVEAAITRVKKGGGLGKPRRTSLQNYTYAYYRPGYLQPEDDEVAPLLASLCAGGWDEPVVAGSAGHFAVLLLVRSGRCFWHENPTRPLRLAGERPLRLGWRTRGDGASELAVVVEPAGEVLLTEPPLYLDPAEGVVGPVATGGITSRQLGHLLAAPVVPAAVADRFSLRLAAGHPGLPVPPPRPVAITDVAGPHCPVLTLHGEAVQARHVHFLDLRFAYAGHAVPALPPEVITTVSGPDRVVRIHRDLDHEERAIDRLEDLGFAPYQRPGDGAIVWFSPAEVSRGENAARWWSFLHETLPGLEAEGWRIERDASFRLRFTSAEQWHAEVDEGAEGWFDLRFDVEIDGVRRPLLPLIAPLLGRFRPDELPDPVTLPVADDTYVTLPAARVRLVLETLYELYDRTPGDDLRLARVDAARLAELEEGGLTVRGGNGLRELGRRLRDFRGIETVPSPCGLRGELRPYQARGVDWLQFLRAFGLSGILADDMGLGKTVQALTHLLVEKEAGRGDRPSLLVAPTSLMGNWRREAQRFTPDLRVVVLHGADRQQHFAQIGDADLVITTYPLLLRDGAALTAHDYHYLVLDEAQAVKNPRAKAARVVREICARHRLCLTGTPMENHLGELWAQFDFLMPGFLGDAATFTARWRRPIEKVGDDGLRERLARRVAPFLLRRTKGEVAAELPPKTEILRTVPLGERQATLYESIRLAMERKVREAIAAQGLARSHITILDALLKLRQTCCDPRLLPLKQAAGVKSSAKLELLMDLVPEQLAEGRRILLFSQFTRMLALIEEALAERRIGYTKLTGQTRDREAAIDRFRRGEVDLFLISLKAGGVGLNLTEADTVILYDPWWNPAVEAQAADRTHRIGQDKPVFVYKLLTEATVEEKILALQEKKRALVAGITRPRCGGEVDAFTAADLAALFAPLSGEAGEHHGPWRSPRGAGDVSVSG
jgi:superfamily II DNA or RNA helicase